MSGPTSPASTFAAELVSSGPISGRQFLILAICFTLNMIDGFDITVMSFTAPPIGDEFALSKERLGIVFSAALAGMMIGAMFLAPLSDIVGRRKTIIGCVTVIGISMYATAYITGLWSLAAVRFVTGLGIGAMLASLAAIAAEYLPERYRSFGVVAITAGYPFGATVGAFIAAPVIAEFGWRSVFYGGGIATLAMLAAIWFFVPESLEYLCQRRRPDSLARVNAILARIGKPPVAALPTPAPGRSADDGSMLANMLRLLAPRQRSQTLMVWATFFFCFIALYFLMSWIPTLVLESGLSLEKGIYTSSFFNLGGVAGIFLLGYLSTRQPLSMLIGGFICSAAVLMMLFGLAPKNVLVLWTLTALIGLLMQGGFTGMYAVAAKVYPAEIRTTGVGWAIGLGRFGAVVGPYAGGVLIDAQFSMAANFAIFGVPLLIGGLLAAALRVR